MKAKVRNTRKHRRHHVEVELELTTAEIIFLLEHGKLYSTPRGKTVIIKEVPGPNPNHKTDQELIKAIEKNWREALKDQAKYGQGFIKYDQPGMKFKFDSPT